MSADPGSYGLIIMRMLAKAPMSADELSAKISAVAAPQVLAILGQLVARKYVKHTFSKYRLTDAGLNALPKSAPPTTMRPYVPERVLRRAGSDVAGKLPSVYAGQRVERT